MWKLIPLQVKIDPFARLESCQNLQESLVLTSKFLLIKSTNLNVGTMHFSQPALKALQFIVNLLNSC